MPAENYSFKVDETDQVTDVIVGESDWANANLTGAWNDSVELVPSDGYFVPGTENLVGRQWNADYNVYPAGAVVYHQGKLWVSSDAVSAEPGVDGRWVEDSPTPFDVETTIGWNALFYTGGTDMQARAYADGAEVSVWDNEVGVTNLSRDGASGITWDASNLYFNNQPTVKFDASTTFLKWKPSDNAEQPTYPLTHVLVAKLDQIPAGQGTQWFGNSNAGQETSYGHDNSGAYLVRQGSNLTAGTATTDVEFAVVYFDSSTGSKAIVNGTTIVGPGSAGTEEWASSQGNLGKGRTSGSSIQGGDVAFYATYEGDLTKHARYSDFVAWVNDTYIGDPPPVMSGGTETTPGDGYKYHTFTTSDTLTVTSGGFVEYLVVGGGGGGGGRANASTNTGGGGGGAGGLLSGTMSITETQTITVGAGGSGSGDLVDPTNGTGSSIGVLVTTDGGGAGDSGSNGGGASLRDGQDGGSGGGGGDNGSSGGYVGLGGTATAGQGNDGGNSFGTTSGNEQAGGGGGGAGAAGQDAPALRIAGDGGAGVEWPTSSGDYYAGGGGGGNAWVNMDAGASAGDGGIGGGGKGDDSLGGGSAAADGTANTGGGGGGSGRSTNGGGDGGSGIVIVRYPV